MTAAAEDAATTRVAVTDMRGEAELAALNPSTSYVVTVELQGFQTSRQENFLVRAGQTASARVTLTAGNVTETVVVTAASPVVDVTSAVVAEDITLDLTEAVPTGRTYQSYLQLVPGVFPDDPESPGNPASKSGLNYSDIGGHTALYGRLLDGKAFTSVQPTGRMARLAKSRRFKFQQPLARIIRGGLDSGTSGAWKVA